MNDYLDGACCEPDSGQCCGPGSWCCKRAGKHDHDELERIELWTRNGHDRNTA